MKIFRDLRTFSVKASTPQRVSGGSSLSGSDVRGGFVPTVPGPGSPRFQ